MNYHHQPDQSYRIEGWNSRDVLDRAASTWDQLCPQDELKGAVLKSMPRLSSTFSEEQRGQSGILSFLMQQPPSMLAKRQQTCGKVLNWRQKSLTVGRRIKRW